LPGAPATAIDGTGLCLGEGKGWALSLAEPLLTVCPDSHHRVLAVLAVAADQPLSGGETARRAGMGDTAALDALDLLAAGEVVGPVKASNVSHHGLYTDHVAANAVLALAALSAKLVERVAAHVAAWEPPPATVALRLPCPSRSDAQRRELIDLLVVPGDGEAGGRALVASGRRRPGRADVALERQPGPSPRAHPRPADRRRRRGAARRGVDAGGRGADRVAAVRWRRTPKRMTDRHFGTDGRVFAAWPAIGPSAP
jgi:hypothetical protein